MLHAGQTNYPLSPTYLQARRAWFQSIFRHGHNKSVFTHGDLTQGNIRVCNDKTIVLIDWQYSGWYPSYWEYCFLACIAGADEDWLLWIPSFLDEYIAELGWMCLFRAWVLWGGA